MGCTYSSLGHPSKPPKSVMSLPLQSSQLSQSYQSDTRNKEHYKQQNENEKENEKNIPMLLDKTIENFHMMKCNIITMKDNLIHQQKLLEKILNTNPDILRERQINKDKIMDMFLEMQTYITCLDKNYDKLEYYTQKGEIMKVLNEVKTFQEISRKQIENWSAEYERGYDFIRDKLIPAQKHCDLCDIIAIKEVPIPDPDIEKEFVALDKSMDKLNSSYLFDLAEAISSNISHDSKKNGQEGAQYIYKDLFEHIHMIKITLQHIARKEDKMSDKRFVKAYRNIEYLLSLYIIQNNTFNVMKKALDDMLSSLRLLQ